ncbi:MAG: hypothetical protein J6D37_07465 [Clostridia bacterium]|nr:hypothetical protein [Clostridia bacterium]
MNLTLDELKSCLSDGLSECSLQAGDVTFQMQTDYVFSSEEEPTHVYRLSFGRRRKKFDTAEALLAYLAPFAPFTLLSLDGKEQSFEEFCEERAFFHISMPDLLKRYEEATLFSLTAPAWVKADVPCTKEAKEGAQKSLRDALLSHLRKIYEGFSKKDKKRLGDFDALFSHIEEEVLAAYRKLKKTPFLCDKFALGKTDFTSPDGLWHFYHDAEFVEEARRRLTRLKSSPSYEESTIFEEERYAHLKESLLFAKAGFVWHCTLSGSPATTYFFRLDERTKAWLLQFKNDYALCEEGLLEDFALYRSEEDCLFSSCTHEGFHVEV